MLTRRLSKWGAITWLFCHCISTINQVTAIPWLHLGKYWRSEQSSECCQQERVWSVCFNTYVCRVQHEDKMTLVLLVRFFEVVWLESLIISSFPTEFLNTTRLPWLHIISTTVVYSAQVWIVWPSPITFHSCNLISAWWADYTNCFSIAIVQLQTRPLWNKLKVSYVTWQTQMCLLCEVF